MKGSVMRDVWIIVVICSCLALVALFAAAQYSGSSDALAKAQDVFALLSALSLGFLFGRNSK